MQSIGGLEKYTIRLANAFVKKGAKVTLVCADKTPPSFSPQITTKLLTLKQKTSFLKMEEFSEKAQLLCKKDKPDIIFAMERTKFQTHIRAGNGVHKSFLAQRKLMESRLKNYFHRVNPLHKAILLQEKLAFESSDLRTLFTNSEMVKQEILSQYQVNPNKIQVVHNGVEWHEMQPEFSNWVEKRAALNKTYSLDPTAFTFLFIGSGFKRKGLTPLLQALALMKNQNFNLLVVGKDKNITNFQKLSKKLGLASKVHFVGEQKNVYPFYQMADSIVIPSYYDPFANVTVEALAMGLYVISSKYNGGKEVLTEDTGTVIPSLIDIESFKGTLLNSLDYKKTWMSSQKIREQVKHLDYSNRLSPIIETCLV